MVSVVAMAAICLAVGSYSLTGVFSKAFDKTLSPGEQYERSITIKKYYNLTIRFQKQNSTSYLSFNNNETTVILKDSEGKEVAKASGAVNGRLYFLLEKSQLDRIKTVSAYNLESYQDVVDQGVSTTFSGTKAYITVKVSYKPATLAGYVIDELTNQTLEEIEVLAFPDGSDPYTTEPILRNTSTSDGRYLLTFQLDSSKALDIYIKDYIAS
ncbi:MAG: hypothetical protein QMD12_01125 [Candidatus Aenigmarchaeota archaeon]|nr:hypothetical protein [Candidatus Aenigmarchaeota archaeon]